jgi:hypothetical protein
VNGPRDPRLVPLRPLADVDEEGSSLDPVGRVFGIDRGDFGLSEHGGEPTWCGDVAIGR